MGISSVAARVIPLFVHMMEAMGVFVITFGAIKAFYKYGKRRFDFSDDNIKLEFAQALALGLEFKLGGEILKTLMIRTIEELVILGSIVILRVALTFVIHWEISSSSKSCNNCIDNLNEEQETL